MSGHADTVREALLSFQRDHDPTQFVDKALSALAALERERDTLRAAHTELARCVINGWTEPAFARGPLQTRAVDLSRKALASVRDEQESQ